MLSEALFLTLLEIREIQGIRSLVLVGFAWGAEKLPMPGTHPQEILI